MDNINISNKLTILLENNKLIEKINKVFGNFLDLPLNILFQISDNQKLFSTISEDVVKFFVSLSDAIECKSDDDILLHLGKINLYALLTQGQYIDIFDEPSISEIYQIILLSEKQKIILTEVCSALSIKEIAIFGLLHGRQLWMLLEFRCRDGLVDRI